MHHLLLSQGSEGSIDLQSVGACRGLIVFIRVCVRSEEWISHYMLLCAKHSRHQKENISDNDRECCYCKNKIYLYLIWEHRSKQTHSKVRLHQFHRVAGFLCHLLLDFTIRRYNSTRVALLSSFFKKTKQKKTPSPGRGVSRSGFSCELICLHGIESGSPHEHASGNYAYLMQFH